MERLAVRGAEVSNDWDVRQSVKLDVAVCIVFCVCACVLVLA